MKCPVCDETLREVQKYGVTVDICPGCKGVWLDRGELERISELMVNGGPNSEMRSDQSRSQHMPEEPRRLSRDHDDDHDYREKRERGYDEHSHEGYSKKKKGSWLGDILGGFSGGED